VKAVIRQLQQIYRRHAFAFNILTKYGIGLAVLFWVILKNWKGLVAVFSSPIHVGPLFLAAAVAIVGLLITFLRWHLLVRAIDIPFSRYSAIRLGLAGYYFNTFLPGSIGGDIVKGYAIARDPGRRTRALTTIAMDRVIGLWALILFVAILGSIFWILQDPIVHNPKLMAIVIFSMVFVGVSTTIWILLTFLPDAVAARFADRIAGIKKIGGPLAELWRACWMYHKQWRAVLIAVLMSLAGHTCWVFVFDLSVRTFETPNSEADVGTLQEHMVIVPVGMTVSAVIPVPGGIGVGDAAYGKLYEMMGKEREYGIAGCMSQRVIFWCLGFIGYIIYTRMPERVDSEEPLGEKEPPGEPGASASPPDPEPPPGGAVLRPIATDS